MMKLQMRVGGMFWCAPPPPADWIEMPVAAALTAAGGGGADRYPGRGRRGRGNVAAGADAVDIAEWRNASVGGGGGRKGDGVGMRRMAHAVTVARIAHHVVMGRIGDAVAVRGHLRRD